MAVPKKRTSRQKKLQRRTHWKLTAPNVSRCPNCNEPALSHQVCPSCGTYRGRKLVVVEE